MGPILLVAALVVAATPLLSQGEGVPSQSDSVRAAGVAGLDSLIDAVVTEQMHRWPITGLAVAAVHEGKLVVSRGYGVANRATGTAVDPERTLFPLGSISKVYTTVAVMQQVDAGRVHLDEDVNAYLRAFRLNTDSGYPVRVRHLLTHTGGFMPRFIGSASRHPDNIEPLGEYLARAMPPFRDQPGELYLYSDHGMSLAGHIVELVSGLPFARYMDERVFAPLRLERSSFIAPPRDHPQLAIGYEYDYGRSRYREATEAYVRVVPAGGVFTSAADAARFLAVWLDSGSYAGRRILSDSSWAEMTRRQFANHPALSGTALGMYEYVHHGDRGLRHGGWMPGHTSFMVLVPGARLGLFVAANSTETLELRQTLTRELVSRFGTAQPMPPANAEVPVDVLRRLAGNYRQVEFADAGFERVGYLLVARQLTVALEADGALRLTGTLDGATTLRPISSTVFRREDGMGNVVFVLNERSDPLRLMAGLDLFDRVPIAEEPVIRVTAAASLLLFLSACIVWPVGAIAARSGRRERSATGGLLPSVALVLAATVSAAYLIVVGALVHAVVFTDTHDLAFGLPTVLELALLLLYPAMVLTLALPLLCVAVWRRRFWSRAMRLHFTAVAVAAVAFVPLLFHLGVPAYGDRSSSAIRAEASTVGGPNSRTTP